MMTNESTGALGFYNPASLIESTTNPKGRRDVSDLIESVKAQGILEPLLGRLTPTGEVQIVCGHRRRAAALAVGLAEVPVVVRARMTDADALMAQIVENRDRQNVHPMDEAEQYEALLKIPKSDDRPRTVEDVAADVGVSPSYLTRRLALLKLDPDAREAFTAGRIETSVALLIATLRKADQKKALVDLAAPADGTRGAIPYRAALEHVRRVYLLRLSEAPFSLTDDTLVPGVGACGSCPKRTGSNPNLFGEFDAAELCTDSACHGKKVAAAWARLAIAARDSGQTVLGDKEAGEVFRFGSSTPATEAGYVDVDEPCRDDPKERTFRDILGAALPATTLARDARGGVHHLLEKKAARKAVLATLPKKAVEKAEEAEKVKEAESEAVIEDAIRKATYALAIEAFGKRALKSGIPMRIVIDALLPKAPDTRKAWKLAEEGALDKVKGGDLNVLALEAALEILGFDAFMRGEPGWVEAVAKTYQIDLKKLRAKADAQTAGE